MKANIGDVKTHLSEYPEKVPEGETLEIGKRNESLAELNRLPKRQMEPRPLGLAKGQVHIPDSFWQPLPDDILEGFYGGPIE